MAEEEIVALEERARKVGGTGESPFAHRFPFSLDTTSLSISTSFTFQSIFSVQHFPHITGSKYFKASDQEHVEEIVEEKECRNVLLGQNGFDAARQSRMFHLCRACHEVPEQVQHSGIDDDMFLKWTGQTAYDAAQEHGHSCGDGGVCRHGGKSGEDGFFSEKGNVSLPLSDEEEDWDIWV